VRGEIEKNDTAVAKVKLFSDAMRNTAIKLSNDPIELLPFFLNVECLYDESNVSENLRVQLLRPYLSERSKILLTLLDSDSAKDYGKVKEFLLHQFQLSPRVFLARFNNVRQSDETMILFASKLKSLLHYYLNSRKVDTFEQFVSLMITDRMKTTLSEDCLRHILSVEAGSENGWLEYDKLAVIVDTYYSNHLRDKPVVGGTMSAMGNHDRTADKKTVGSAASVPVAARSHSMNVTDTNRQCAETEAVLSLSQLRPSCIALSIQGTCTWAE